MRTKRVIVLLIMAAGILCLVGLYMRQGIATVCSFEHTCNSGSQSTHSPSNTSTLLKIGTLVSSQPDSNWRSIVSSAQDTHESVFEECQSFFESDLKAIEANSMARPGFLAGRIDAFTKKGAESRSVDVVVGRRDTEYGNRPLCSNIVQYTDTEVQQGNARNAAARLAVLHYFTTPPRRGTPYEQIEIMRLFMRWWYGASYSELTGDEVIDLYESVAKDRSRSLIVREYAAATLPPDRRPDMTELMLDILRDNTIGDEHLHDPIVERACSYLKGAECLDLLQSVLAGAVTQIPSWKAQRIRRAAGLPFKEPAKEAAANTEVELSP